MLVLIWMSAAVASSWDCDTTASFSSLEEMRPWFEAMLWEVPFSVDYAFDAWRIGIEDASCEAFDCSWSEERLIAENYTAQECATYACTTGEGYAVAYAYEWKARNWGVNQEWTDTHWQVAGPAGLEVDWSSSHVSQEGPGANDPFIGSADAVASWSGQPYSSLPADSGFESHYTYESTTMFGATTDVVTHRWSTAGCTAVISSEESQVGYQTDEVTFGPTTGRVATDMYACTMWPRGFLNGEVVGAVDIDSWALEPGDADHDGSPDDEDCDAVDPERSPCAEEIPADGIDQDCDGVDASAFAGPPVPTSASTSVPAGCAGAIPLPLALLRRRRPR